MKNLKDITKTEMKITSNKSARTFTIRKNGSKYRTGQFEKQEFQEAEMFWTGNDWSNFLRSSNDYYIVK